MSGHPELEDQAVAVEIDREETLSQGFRRFARYHVTLHEPGAPPQPQVREIVHVGQTAGVLAIDAARGGVVLLRQFRLAAHLATGRGEMIEVPAGLVEPGEAPEAAARRECREETGLEPIALRYLFSCLISPGVADELGHFFLALVDATHLPAAAGAAGEAEVTRPFLCPIADAVAAMEAGSAMTNSYLRLMLQWLAAHRAEVDEMARTAAGAA